jgi:hypothetical protein
MFNKNSLWFGILLGVTLPLALYGLLYGVLYILKISSGPLPEFDENLLMLISPVINLFTIRYYFVNKKYDDTGRGILLVTFIYVIAYFVIY